MTEQKKPASPDSLTQAGQDAKIELSEQQLDKAAGGVLIGMLKIDSAVKLQPAGAAVDPAQAASLNFSLKI
jgi:hypothetical protein